MLPTIQSPSDLQLSAAEEKTNNYAQKMREMELNYIEEDPFIKVGDPLKTEGWILHISVIISQIGPLLDLLLPKLKEAEVAFKIPMDSLSASNILNGNFGTLQLGKVVTIYPETEILSLAQTLVELTRQFSGPRIPTDIHLGGVVYTRYGSINPVMIEENNGKKCKYIHDVDGNLVKDPYSIPFQLPTGISWPFAKLAECKPIPVKKIMKNTYKTLSCMKYDSKGNVYKALYVINHWRLKYCVIKQGTHCMQSEENGRTIRDRLIWQNNLASKLEGCVPMPKIIDFFDENGDSYLVMEYIKGISLYDRICEINFNNKSWNLLSLKEKRELVGYLITITTLIEKIQNRGFVHRDIAPGNFLLNKKGELILIDLELAYSVTENEPDPPFEYGTHGFMSPNQMLQLTPSPKDDIYSLGALMLIVFSGLSPTKFNTKDSGLLLTALQFLTNNETIASMIAGCLSHNPAERPKLESVKKALENYKEEISSTRPDPNPFTFQFTYYQSDIQELIMIALKGLIRPPVVMSNDLWYSKYVTLEDPGAHTQQDYIRYNGLYEGISGVLYLIASAKLAGFSDDLLNYHYRKGLKFLDDQYSDQGSNIAPGFYGGSAGMALCVSKGISAGLIEDFDYYGSQIRQYLDRESPSLTLATGLAGQGIALIQCASFLEPTFVRSRLEHIVQKIISAQLKDGSWITENTFETTHRQNPFSFAHGIPSIICFLLKYQSLNPDRNLEKAIVEALSWLLNATDKLKRLLSPRSYRKLIPPNQESGDERKGIIYTLIKAYEQLKDPQYKKYAEEALMNYSRYITKNDFSQHSGLAGLGEIYLEAFRIFKTPEWQHRADWITQIFFFTFFDGNRGSGYWMMEERNDPTADFMVGTSGIIHYLLRYAEPGKMGYRLIG